MFFWYGLSGISGYLRNLRERLLSSGRLSEVVPSGSYAVSTPEFARLSKKSASESPSKVPRTSTYRISPRLEKRRGSGANPAGVAQICKSLPLSDEVAKDYITGFFKSISILLPVHASKHALDTQSDEIFRRIEAAMKQKPSLMQTHRHGSGSGGALSI